MHKIAPGPQPAFLGSIQYKRSTLTETSSKKEIKNVCYHTSWRSLTLMPLPLEFHSGVSFWLLHSPFISYLSFNISLYSSIAKSQNDVLYMFTAHYCTIGYQQLGKET